MNICSEPCRCKICIRKTGRTAEWVDHNSTLPASQQGTPGENSNSGSDPQAWDRYAKGGVAEDDAGIIRRAVTHQAQQLALERARRVSNHSLLPKTLSSDDPVTSKGATFSISSNAAISSLMDLPPVAQGGNFGPTLPYTNATTANNVTTGFRSPAPVLSPLVDIPVNNHRVVEPTMLQTAKPATTSNVANPPGNPAGTPAATSSVLIDIPGYNQSVTGQSYNVADNAAVAADTPALAPGFSLLD